MGFKRRVTHKDLFDDGEPLRKRDARKKLDALLLIWQEKYRSGTDFMEMIEACAKEFLILRSNCSVNKPHEYVKARGCILLYLAEKGALVPKPFDWINEAEIDNG